MFREVAILVFSIVPINFFSVFIEGTRNDVVAVVGRAVVAVTGIVVVVIDVVAVVARAVVVVTRTVVVVIGITVLKVVFLLDFEVTSYLGKVTIGRKVVTILWTVVFFVYTLVDDVVLCD